MEMKIGLWRLADLSHSGFRMISCFSGILEKQMCLSHVKSMFEMDATVVIPILTLNFDLVSIRKRLKNWPSRIQI